jgi:hypothetical protein
LIFSLNFHLIYNAALYRKTLPEGRTTWTEEGLLAEEMPDFLVIQCVAEREWQFTTMGSLISPVGRNCSKYLKIFTPNKKDLNATARMHFAYFCKALRRIG